MSNVKSNIAANYVGSGWVALMGIAFTPLYIYYLGIEAYGVIGIFALLQAWLFLLDMGLTPTISREMARFDGGEYTPQNICNLVRSLELVYILISVAISIGFIIGSTWITNHWLQVNSIPKDEVANALALTGVFISLRWHSGLYRGALVGLQRQVWLNASNSIFSTCRGFGVVLVMAWLSPTLSAFFIFQSTVSFLELLVLRTKVNQLLPTPPASARFHWSSLRKIWKFMTSLSVNMVLITLLQNVDKLIILKVLTLTQFGYYTLASTLASGLYQAMGAITNVAYPRFTLLVSLNKTEALMENYHKFSQLLVIILIPSAMVVSFFSENILLLWTQNSATSVAVAPLVSLLIIGNMIYGVTQISVFLQLAYGWTRLNLVANFCSIVVTIPALYFAIPVYGAIAAPVIWILVNSGCLILTIPIMHHRLLPTEMWFWYKNTLIFPVLGSLISILTVYYIMPSPSLEFTMVNIFTLTVASIAGLVVTVLSTPLGRSKVRMYIAKYYL